MTNINTDIQLDFQDVLLKPKRSTISSRKDAVIVRDYNFKINDYIETVKGTGIMTANMSTVGVFATAKKMLEKGLFATLHKHYSVHELYDFFSKEVKQEDIRKVFVSIGLRDEDYNKLKDLYNKLNENLSICIDVPNAYIPQVKDLVIKCRKDFPQSIIMVGNVVTGDITEDFILSGANIVKIGIGPGSQCITRKQTGVGRPQLSTILECADAAHQVGGMVCADGGITCPGDVCKAFAAGADFIMIGGLYAGTDEADSELLEEHIKTNQVELDSDGTISKYIIKTNKYKISYGMSSKLAQDKFYKGMPNYRASEGRVVKVPYTSSIDSINDEILGGLRSCMTYLGAKRLKDLPKSATFYKVNNQLNTIFEKYEITGE